ncbi:hypothetical protein MIMGU_mgv11b020478mg [Erythranthe guttata]|uniref:Protein kinase domain-containing protein n=1 Tax=Erythranthe guttata TaxID=4155 RepID=A0A022QVY7_ERYGU|nr:hypothetical protein MIMGU_mgv11b020478mg [Erythranthe guttata]
MPPLPGKSIRCALRSSFRNGLPGSSDVAFILSGTLKGLDHMHRVKNAVHPNVGADCIFIDGQRVVRLATRSLSYCTCDYVHLTCHVDFYVETSKCGGACGYPDWANPPELLTKKNGEGQKSNNKATDVWMFGLLAVELFYGRIPEDFRLWDIDARKKYKEKKKRNRLWSCLRREREEEEMPEEQVAACLSDDPRKSDNNKFLKKGEKERWIIVNFLRLQTQKLALINEWKLFKKLSTNIRRRIFFVAGKTSFEENFENQGSSTKGVRLCDTLLKNKIFHSM